MQLAWHRRGVPACSMAAWWVNTVHITLEFNNLGMV